MARTLLAIAVLALIAASCGPGPLPDVPSRNREYDHKADWFPTQSEDRLPLDVAIYSGRIDEVRALLEAGADPNARWGQSGDRFPLQEVLNSRGYPTTDPAQTVRLLLEHGADPNAKWCPYESRGASKWSSPRCVSAKGMTALMFAARSGRADIAETLLQAGADARPRNWLGRSALDFAYDDIVFELISRRLFPDLSTRDQKSLEWLNEAESRYGMPLLRALHSLDDGQHVIAPPRADSSLSDGPVEAEKRMLSRVRTLLRIGADPNARVTSDRPLLSHALYNRTLRVARALLRGGADVNQRWCELFHVPWAPLANQPKHLIIIWPNNVSKDPSCTFGNGITSLMWSAGSGDSDLVRLLLEFNADRSLKDWAGRSALDYAMTDEIRKLLTTGQ